MLTGQDLPVPGLASLGGDRPSTSYLCQALHLQTNRPNAPYLLPSTLPQNNERSSTFYLGLGPASSDTNKPGFGLAPARPIASRDSDRARAHTREVLSASPQDLPSHTCRLHSVSPKSSEIHSHLPNSFLWRTYHIPSTGTGSSPWGLPKDVNVIIMPINVK